MSKYNVQDPEYIITEVDGRKTRLLTTTAFERFNPSILGLGQLTSAAAATDAIAAIFQRRHLHVGEALLTRSRDDHSRA